MAKNRARIVVIVLMMAISGGVTLNAVWQIHQTTWYYEKTTTSYVYQGQHLETKKGLVRREDPHIELGLEMARLQGAIAGITIMGTLSVGVPILWLLGKNPLNQGRKPEDSDND